MKVGERTPSIADIIVPAQWSSGTAIGSWMRQSSHASVRRRAYAGNFPSLWQFCDRSVRMENRLAGRFTMHGIIYLVGLIVVVLAILSFFGLR